jgi:acylphosphatase
VGLISLRVTISGRVQGVAFRDFTRHQAVSLGLTGYVRNLLGGEAVEMEAEGERASLEKMLEIVRRGPPRAVVRKISHEWGTYTAKFTEFRISY